MATSFLHNLGTLLYFGDDENLRDVIILDPQWLAAIMSTIITTKHNYLGREGYEGILQHSMLPFIWRPPTFPDDLHGFFLYLLNKFDIAFTLYEGDDDSSSAENQDSILSFLPTTSFNVKGPSPDLQSKRLSERLSATVVDSKQGGPSTAQAFRMSMSNLTLRPRAPPVADKASDMTESRPREQSPLKRKTTRELLSELINRPISQKLKNNGYSLVPALLATKRPDDLATVWPLRQEGDGILEYGRIYTFDFTPTGFFAKVSTRSSILHAVNMPHLSIPL